MHLRSLFVVRRAAIIGILSDEGRLQVQINARVAFGTTLRFVLEAHLSRWRALVLWRLQVVVIGGFVIHLGRNELRK